MSVEIPAKGQPRLLPEALEDSVRSWAIRASGCTLVAFAVTSWLGLLTWRAGDSGLAGAAAQPIRMVLGPFGTAASDFMLQTLGIAAVFALIGPMIWGLELLASSRPLPFIRGKLMLFPVGVLALAGALSGLPTISAWPLHNGYGGMLGDIIFNLATVVFNVLHPDRGSLLAGLVMAFTGFALTARSAGLELQHFLHSEPRSTPGDAANAIGEDARRGLFDRLGAAGQGLSSRLWGSPSEQVIEVEDEARDGICDNDDDTNASDMEHDAAAHRVTEVRAVGATPAASGQPAGSDGAVVGRGRTAATSDKREPSATQSRVRTKQTTRSAGPVAADPIDDRDEQSAEADQTRAFAARFAPGGRQDRAETRTANAREKIMPLIKATLALAVRGSGYRKPSLDLLRRPGGSPSALYDSAAVGVNAHMLQTALADFGVSGTIRDAKPGPVVTRYEFEPARGTKTARIVGLAEDIARSLSVNTVRIATIPGRSTIGIEVPNPSRVPVLLREIFETETFRLTKAILPLALGRGIGGEVVVADLARMPHLLIAGTTGSGKSVGINAMILSLVYSMTPDECRLLLIDPKMLELAPYNDIPHLAAPVVTNASDAADALESAVAEMENRYLLMAKLGVRNIEAYNKRVRYAGGKGRDLVRTVQTGYDADTGRPVFEHEQLNAQPLPYLVIVVDEFADLMMVAGERVEAAVQRLSQMARAAGIHLVMATQRPTVDIVTGTIKANMPMRLSFRVASKIDSRTILNEPGAEQLLGQGDMLLSCGTGQLFRIHGAHVTDDEIERVAQSLRDQNVRDGGGRSSAGPLEIGGGRGEPHGAEKAPAVSTAAEPVAAESSDEGYDSAVWVVANDRKASPGHLHRRLGIGEIVASAYIERMEVEGLVGQQNAFGRRRIMIERPTAEERDVA